ncbi:tumor necrosis factor receptor superfamily member 6B-like [Narcine bancroftii]|uniref:tumor necrosis factor receptor superfamily member 6B-like n=1 Tax=Narcine bancroftii TaxID=1343680 RepID=UPI0038321C63
MGLKHLISIVLIINISRSLELVKAKHTYQRREAATGRMVTCEMCPPGKFVVKHCTSSRPTVCGPCPELHYTRYWNYLQKCRYCNVYCVEHQFEKQQCNATRNRGCECRAGYYLEFEFCLEHSKCPAGAGVVEAGTPFQDTSCEQCADGFFSATSSSSERCIKHTNCTVEGLAVIVQGNPYHDTLCTSCTKYIGDSINTSACNEAFLQFVAHQRIPRRKLRRLLSLLSIKNIHKLCEQMLQNKNIMYVTLYQLLVKWKETRKEEDVAKIMISILGKAKLKNVVQKLRKRFL